MGTMTFAVDDEMERIFREVVRKEKGDGRGKFDEAVEEAMQKWVEEKRAQKTRYFA